MRPKSSRKSANKPGTKQHRGLQTKINPVLLSSNLNLVTVQHRDQNPYLSTSNERNTNNKLLKRFERGLVFHEKGEVTLQIEQEREKQRQEITKRKEEEEATRLREAKEEAERKIKVFKGELPDLNACEDKFILHVEDVPAVEWWDRGYIDENLQILDKYSKEYDIDDEGTDEEDENVGPSIRYVHHPAPLKSANAMPAAKVYLTKKEQKKIRRNKRKLLREEIETKIKLGLEPKPQPKVKLSNMMNVYENNQNITDPTKWEHSVIEQVRQRRSEHLEENAKRHQEAILKRKENPSHDVNTPLETTCKVFWFKSIQNPKIRYKVNMNSRQLSLKGACLRIRDDGPGLIIIAGKEKSCKFFEKLITKRIKWDENFEDRDDKSMIDMQGNYAKLLWEGYLDNRKFPNWFMKVCHDEEDLRNTLRKFDAENFIGSITAPKEHE